MYVIKHRKKDVFLYVGRNTIKERDLDNCTTYLFERGARSALSTYTTKFYLNQFYQSLPSDYTIVPIEIKLKDVL
jgi:hypothetical protein